MSEVSEIAMAVIGVCALLAPIITAYYARRIDRIVEGQDRLEKKAAQLARKVGKLPCVVKKP